jgi:hypothetical protein
VIVDRLMKMAHYIPLCTSEGSEAGIRRSMSTAFHPQRDGQTERINEVLKAYNMPEMQWIRPAKSTCTNPASERLIARWQGIRTISGRISMMPSRAKRYFSTKHPSKKLDHKKIGPVRITALVGKRAVRVELPPTMRQHNVSNVVSLEPY